MANRQLWRLSLLLSLICLCRPALAGVRPSFSLEYSAWHSTHIVLVKTTATDGTFEVIETWKGDLRIGDRISIPELRPLSNAEPISMYPKSWPFDDPHADQVPKQPVGSRMILFLRRAPTETYPWEPLKPAAWEASDLLGSMKASVLWIENGHIYCFIQNINPGPSTLSPCNYSETDIRGHFKEVNEARQTFTEVIAIADRAERAKYLKDYVRSSIFVVRVSALQELGKCGPPAVPTVRAMLDDPEFAHERSQLIRVLAIAGGKTVGENLHNRLKQDLVFWKSVAPSLSQGWWNQDVTPNAPLRERYSETYALVDALQQVRYSPAQGTAKELRDFWESHPQLKDVQGLAEECNKLIAQLEAK